MKGTRKSNSFKREEIELLCHLFEKLPTNPEFRLLVRRPSFAEVMRRFYRMREQIRLDDLALADAQHAAKDDRGVINESLATVAAS